MLVDFWLIIKLRGLFRSGAADAATSLVVSTLYWLGVLAAGSFIVSLIF